MYPAAARERIAMHMAVMLADPPPPQPVDYDPAIDVEHEHVWADTDIVEVYGVALGYDVRHRTQVCSCGAYQKVPA